MCVSFTNNAQAECKLNEKFSVLHEAAGCEYRIEFFAFIVHEHTCLILTDRVRGFWSVVSDQGFNRGFSVVRHEWWPYHYTMLVKHVALFRQ